MLDEFSTVKLEEKDTEAPSGTGQPNTASPPEAAKLPSMDDILSDNDFAQQLQAGMADLLGDMENSVGLPYLSLVGDSFELTECRRR